MDTTTGLGRGAAVEREREGPGCCAIVGAGRLGTALAEALSAAGVTVDGPLGRALWWCPCRCPVQLPGGMPVASLLMVVLPVRPRR